MSKQSPDHEKFADLVSANKEYAQQFKYSELTGSAARGLAIVTCMDSRINPLSVVGMRSGDAKILRNAGARVTEDVLRTLVLATYLLNVNIRAYPLLREGVSVIGAIYDVKSGAIEFKNF